MKINQIKPQGLLDIFSWPLRRSEHDFVPMAGPDLSDPARGPLRAGSWSGLRHKIARKPFGPRKNVQEPIRATEPQT